MNTTVIIPVSSSSPSNCPSCGKPEKKIEVCKYCGHEYKEEPIGCLTPIVITLIVILIIWIMVTLLAWFACYGYDCSLLNTVKEQWEWITNLKIY